MASGPAYDVVVVGARCAGAPLAMLLARAGHRVALVDRASFPSDTMSTHFLWQRGTARLQAWGLLGRLRARGCAPIRQITFDPGPVQISGTGPAVAGAADTYCPRRTVLDTLLVEAAAESGADLIERFVAGEVIWSDGRAAGVRGRHPGSAGSSLRAAVVVGADGMHSGIARMVGARAYKEHRPLTAVYYSYWSGIRGPGASFHARSGQLILTWPTNDDLTCIYVAWPRQDFHRVRRDIEGRFHAALELIPGLREAVAAGHREDRFTGTADLPSFYRASAGPGWALAGDAGHHKDPCTGMGMSDAFLTADLLAGAIHQGLSGNQPMDQALASYQQRRDAMTANGFELTLSTARLAPLSPRLEALYRTAADRPEIARHVFGVLGGSIPLTDLHTQARLLPAVCGVRDGVEGAWSRFRQSARRVTGRACPQAAFVVVCLRKCGWRGQTELMRVVVTLVGPDGAMRRRMVDTAASSDTGPWEELLARALAALPPYRAVPGGTVYHLRVDDQVVLVAEQDLSGPLYDLVTAVLAIGEPPH